MKETLYGKFNNVMTRPGRGGSYPYIKWQDVADRMNCAFGINWSSKVESQEVIGNNVVVRVKVEVLDPTTGTVHCQEGFGGAQYDERQEAGNPHKSAYSKALKDACKKWGIGLYMEEEGEQDLPEAPHVPSGYTGKEYGVPDKTTVPAYKPPVEPMKRPSMTQGSGMSTPPGVSMGGPGKQGSMIPPNSNGKMTTTPPSRGFVPPSQSNGSFDTDMPMSKTPPINMGGPEYISDVQKAALNSILSIQGVEYENLVREAFETNGIIKEAIPNIEELTYLEAVTVVKYGNDKFRKR